MACDLDALFQSAVLPVLPVLPGICHFKSLTSMSKFLFKILLSVASLGYLFDMTVLSTWEETLAHQLGRKALGCTASVYLFCFSELNIPTLTHPHLPTPHQGAYFFLSVIISLKFLLLAFSLLLLPNQTPASRLRSFWVISLTFTLPCITLS